MSKKRSKMENTRIHKYNLPNVETIKQINLRFMMDAKKEVKDSKGEVAVYHLFGRSYSQMKKYILKLPLSKVNIIDSIIHNYPEKSNIFQQCAYYYRAFSRSQIFFDANHRTGFFSLQRILEIKGIFIDAENDEVVGLTEYIRGQGWLKMGDIIVRLKEKDDEYKFLVEWFKKKLKFR